MFKILALEKYIPGREVSGKEFFESKIQCEKILAKKLAVRCAECSPKRFPFYNLSIHVAPNSTAEQLSRGRFFDFTMYGWEWLRSRYLSL